MKSIIFLSLMIALSMIGCSDEFDPVSFNGEVDLPKEYSYDLMINCYCFPNYVGPHKVHIKENMIIGYELDNKDFDKLEDLEQFTIVALVKQLSDLVAQDPIRQEIELHPNYDFPVSAYIDVDERIADEEWGFQITNFKVIED